MTPSPPASPPSLLRLLLLCLLLALLAARPSAPSPAPSATTPAPPRDPTTCPSAASATLCSSTSSAATPPAARGDGGPPPTGLGQMMAPVPPPEGGEDDEDDEEAAEGAGDGDADPDSDPDSDPDATDGPEWAGFADLDSLDEADADDANSTREALSPSQRDAVKPKPEKRSEARAELEVSAPPMLGSTPEPAGPPGPQAAAVVRGPRRDTHDSRITILGLFELTVRGRERPEGRSELAAARMAVRRLNQMGLIKGYTLHLIHNDTKCDPGAGVDAFFHALYALRSRLSLLLGSACEDVSESLAKVVPYWNIVQMSFGSTSPLLSDRHEFPLFVRTAAPQSSHDAARTALLRAFNWDSVAALSQDRDVHSLAVNSLVTALELANISCRATITFAENDFDDQLTLLKDLDTRIILGSFSREVAPNIFCKALALGVVGEDYAWVLQGAPDDAWWAAEDAACPEGSLADAVEGLLLVSSYGRTLKDDTPSDAGLTYSELVRAVGQEALPVSALAPQTFDAVWALGLALRQAQRAWAASPDAPRLHDFTYQRKDMAAEFLRQIALLNFTGVSGPVSFRQADRIGISLISQVQGGVAQPVALFHPSRGALEWLEGGRVRWAGGHTPVSRRVCVLRVLTVRPDAFLAITCLAALGMLVAVLCLAFNLHYRRLKYIKLSSPRLNNMAAVGCVLVYAAVILLGVDHATLPAAAPFSAVCTARVYLLSAGFSLAFGSMFTKTYRVHRIFTMSYGCYGGSKKKLLQDTQLMSLVGALLLLDVLVVTLWAIVDPMGRHLHNLTMEISPSDRGVVYQTQVEICKSQYTESWLGALYVYKGLLLVVGLYMAWETRRVKIPALNDSHYIGLSVYFVVVCSGLSVALASLLWTRVTLAYVCSTSLVLASTTATLCLLFLPKLHALQTGTADPVGQSMGLRLQCNTRRFVVDEGQEQRYRVQVQNRVYRRELAALQAEAARLELQLESPSVAVSSASVSMGDDSEVASALSVREEVYAAHMHAAHPLAPLLLLAVLPPVTPRASWPSAAPERPRAASTQQPFQSEPQLEPGVSSSSDHHHYMRRETFAGTGTPATGKQGMLGRFLNLFSGRHASLDNRGNSTGSIAGITSALRAHMGYIAGLVPSGTAGRRNDSEASSPVSTRGSTRGLAGLALGALGAGAPGRPTVPPHIAVLAVDEDSKRKFSLAAMCVLSHSNSNASDDDEDDDDDGGREAATAGSAGRLRVRGSPRFPHRVVPLGALGGLGSDAGSGSSRLLAAVPPRGSGAARGRVAGPGAAELALAGARCRSLEDARGVRRSSLGANAPGANYPFRAISLSPNCDVWAIKERGIPFTDFTIREKFLRAQREQLEEKLMLHQLLQQRQQEEEQEHEEEEEEERRRQQQLEAQPRPRSPEDLPPADAPAAGLPCSDPDGSRSGSGCGAGAGDDGATDQSSVCQSRRPSPERTRD